MASGPQRRMTKAWIGGAVALGVAGAIAMGFLDGSGEVAQPREQASFGTIRADGKLVLKVFVPKLY